MSTTGSGRPRLSLAAVPHGGSLLIIALLCAAGWLVKPAFLSPMKTSAESFLRGRALTTMAGLSVRLKYASSFLISSGFTIVSVSSYRVAPLVAWEKTQCKDPATMLSRS